MSETWPKVPFEVGKYYRVRSSFQALRDTFTQGEVLRYRSSAYSRYDGYTGYFFDDEKDHGRSWDVCETEDEISLAKELFEPVEPSASG